MNKLENKFRFIGMILFIIYLLMLLYFLFFAEAFGRGMAVEAHGCNTTTFLEIKRYINNFDKLNEVSAQFVNKINSRLCVFLCGRDNTAFDKCGKF